MNLRNSAGASAGKPPRGLPHKPQIIAKARLTISQPRPVHSRPSRAVPRTWILWTSPGGSRTRRRFRPRPTRNPPWSGRPRSASTSAACTSAPIITGSRCSAGRPYPSIQDVDPHTIGDFGPHSVLLDFSADPEDPEIAFLGRALRVECALDSTIRQISEVPGRSLLSRLTDHYLQIIANRAPIGFEAEFVGMRGHNTLYRGILMPLLVGRPGDRLHLRRDQLEGDRRQRDRRRRSRTRSRAPSPTRRRPCSSPMPATCPAWADGPNADYVEAVVTDDLAEPPDKATLSLWPDDGLGDRLVVARDSAAEAAACDGAQPLRALPRARPSPMISRSPPRRRPRIMPNCSTMPG